jgi:hypothetical protein
MKPLSYRFIVARDGDFPALGLLRDWADGTKAALQHLEERYPRWTQITIQKISEPTTQSKRQTGHLGCLRKSSRRDQSVRSLA